MNNITLDLHGLNENDAIAQLMTSLFTFEESESGTVLEIITGNGEVLTTAVENELDSQGIIWRHENNNFGKYIIEK